MLEYHIEKLKALIKQLIDSSLSEADFKARYSYSLTEYEKYISDRPYWPLKDLVAMSGSDLLKYSAQA